MKMRWLANLALASALATGQTQAANAHPLGDRDQWMPASVTTSDDVLRVPMPPDFNAPEGSFVLIGGRLFDGTGSPARAATIVVQGKTITAVLNPGDRNWPADAVVYDVTGKTVMPGLIDLHTHLTYVDAFDATYDQANISGGEAVMRGHHRMGIYVQSGVTSVRDVASHGEAPFILKKLQSTGAIPGPRVFAAGQLITSTGGHGAAGSKPGDPVAWVRTASGPDEWREAVRFQFARGADLIKLASEYSQAEIDAAVDEAHSLGLPVTVDAETKYIDMAVKAGVDGIEHPLPRSDQTIALMAKRGIVSVPTLAPYRILLRTRGNYYGSTSRRFELTEKTIVDMATKMRRSGIKMGVGLDLIIDWTNYMPGAYIDELTTFTQIGFTKSEALVAATKTGAEILRMSDKLGTIERGKLADIIVIDGNPDEDLAALARVQTVFVNGRLVLQEGKIVVPRAKSVPMPEKKK